MSTNTRCYVDLAFLRTGKLEETPAGALFLPVVAGGRRFLAGRLGDTQVLVALDGDHAFHVAPPADWSKSAGLIARKLRFEAEPKSAIECRDAASAPHGSLVLSDLGHMIVAFDQNGAKAVLLSDGVGETGIDQTNAVAFTSWQIVTDELAPVTLYASQTSPPTALPEVAN